MNLDPLQSTFLGSQLLMSAFSLFLFATYRLRFLLIFAFLALVPLANLMLRDQYVLDSWSLGWTSAEGFRWFILCIGHGLGLHYSVDVISKTKAEGSIIRLAKYIGNAYYYIGLIPLSGLFLQNTPILTFAFLPVYLVSILLWIRGIRVNTTVGAHMLAGVILIAIAFTIDYDFNFRLQEFSPEVSAIYSIVVISGFFLFMATNILVINIFLQARENARLDVEHRTKMATLGEIASSIAHEIKNPLAAISYANELQRNLLQKEPFDRDQSLKLCNNIGKTSGQIKSIVDSLHTMSRNAAHDPFEIVNISTIIERTLTLFTLRLQKSDIQLSLPKVRDDLNIECRETQICQVLLNLLNNAFDAVQDLADKWVRLSVKELDNKVIFSVIDSGFGISEDERRNILRSFYTTKAKGLGTGLGLNITKRIVDAHEGKLNVTIEDGHTCFEVVLPKRIH